MCVYANIRTDLRFVIVFCAFFYLHVTNIGYLRASDTASASERARVNCAFTCRCHWKNIIVFFVTSRQNTQPYLMFYLCLSPSFLSMSQSVSTRSNGSDWGGGVCGHNRTSQLTIT